jgi:uncharacterized protein YuzE
MQTTFDQAADLPHSRATDAEVAMREELKAGFTMELDAEGQIVGFEIRPVTNAIAAGNDLWGILLKEGAFVTSGRFARSANDLPLPCHYIAKPLCLSGASFPSATDLQCSSLTCSSGSCPSVA